MDVTVEKKGAFDREVTIRIPADRVGQLMDRELKRLAGTVRLPGFRMGRIPQRILESRFRDHLMATVSQQLFKETYPKALQETGIRSVAQPVLDLEKMVRGQDFVYKASLEIVPEVIPKGYEGMPLTRMKADVLEADVERMVTEIRKKNARYEPEKEYQAALGDRVELDFAGRIDGKPFDGGSAQKFRLDLGSGALIPEFETQLIGVVSGDTRDVRVTFPENYQAPHLAGKEALFQCSIREVLRRQLPEADDALAKAVGVDEGGMNLLRERIQTQLEVEAKTASARCTKQDLLAGLTTAHAMELPESLLKNERDNLLEVARRSYQKQGKDPDKMGLTDADLISQFGIEKNAVDRVLLWLVLDAIASKEKIEVDDKAVEAHLETMTAKYGDQAAKMKKWYTEDKDRMNGVRHTVLEEQVIDWLMSHATVTEKTCTFMELMDKNAGRRQKVS